MAWSISSLFPSWGDTGEQPPSNFEYQGGDQVNEKHLDYLWDSVGTLEDETRSALNDIDADGDGIVDEANGAQSASTNFNLNGNALTDTAQGYLDLTGDGNDLRLATGKAIEDESGNNRMEISSVRTRIGDEQGNKVISLNRGNYNQIVGYSDTPIIFKDGQGNFDGVTYTTGTSVGTLELTNAELSHQTSQRWSDENILDYKERFATGNNVYGWSTMVRFESPFSSNENLRIRASLIFEDIAGGNQVIEEGAISKGGLNNWGSAGTTYSISNNIRVKVDDNDNSIAYLQVNLYDNYSFGYATVEATTRGGAMIAQSLP